jgi:hypothetical protein
MEYLKTKLINLQQIIKTRMLETYIEEKMNLRRLANLELTR